MQSMSVLVRMALRGHRYFCVQRSRLSLVFPVLTRDPVYWDSSCSSTSLTLVCPLYLAVLADVRRYPVAFSRSGRCAALSRWRSFFFLLWERARAATLGRGQRTALQTVLSFHLFVDSGAQAQVTRLAQQVSRCVRARGVKGVSEGYRMTAWPTIQCLVTQMYQKQSPQC